MTIEQSTIEQNVSERKQAQALFRSMLDLARDDFLKLSDRGRFIFFQIAFEHFQNRLGITPTQPIEAVKELRPVSIENKKVNQAIDDLERLLELCDEIPFAGEHFAVSVSSSARDMIETITASKRVTEQQLTAIDNWTEGVCKWLR
jgi:hypothetical protein